MRLLLPTTALALMLTLPTAAHADWAWTSWTMNLKQVVKASDGAVRKVRGKPGDQVNGWDLRARGRVQQDGMDFQAQFFFDPAGERLRVVKLSPDVDHCEALKAGLIERYGPPNDDSMDLAPGIRMTALRWKDPEHGNFVAYTALPAWGTLEADCFVRYRPVGEPD